MKTDENLKAAFVGESQANRKYTAFARKAEEEGFPQVAKLFRAAAESETVHALSHLRVMKGVGATVENLKTALEGEVYEHTKMYPEFIQTATSEKRRDAQVTFQHANEVEKVHAKYYQEAVDAIKSGKDLKEEEYFVCQVCGFSARGEAPEKCPVCGSPRRLFKAVT
jgi:rubrerythrin